MRLTYAKSQQGERFMQEHPYRVLIIDSDNNSLATYQNYLTQQGFEVDTAQDGIEGIEKLRKDEPDVALVEIKLPKMSGIEIIRLVNEEELDTEIIVLTEHGNKEDAVTVLNLGVGAWFEKSNIDKTQFLEKAQDLCQLIPTAQMRRYLSAKPS
jgi:DNA-binding NtrC family response regulator